VDPQGAVNDIRRSLHNHLNNSFKSFAWRYRERFSYAIEIDPVDAVSSFESVMTAVRESGRGLYLLIDEYDNFANEVMMSRGGVSGERYRALLYGEGALKTVFKAVKAASAGRGLDRVFITGVSPVVMSDVTSGYNVADGVYLEPELSDLCGFTEAEVGEVVQRVAASCEISSSGADEALAMLRTFYDGYNFTEHAASSVYNPTLVLYFLKYFQKRCAYPRQMLDANLALDRAKLAYVAGLPNGGQLILEALEGEGETLDISELADRFGVEDMLRGDKEASFAGSLLYYLGVLTIGGQSPRGKLSLRIPNLVTRRLYAEQIRDMLLPAGVRVEMGRVAEALYAEGEMEPLCDFVEERYFGVFDNRDYRWANELTVKTAFLTLLFDDVLYIMDSEPALERGYADLVMIIRPDMRKYELLDILIEFKYVGLGELGMSGAEVRERGRAELRALPVVAGKLAEAREELAHHRRALEGRYGAALRLRSYAVVSLGFDRLVWEESE